ncbi:hypothetical protein SAMD00019534_108400, partial [Acytostelium subglobosum LB1]|uniref:hypothetical protein n=1 Tax=Acytostelium subglobosum LB1 TaxID=1410327 RepID=UPI0006450117
MYQLEQQQTMSPYHKVNIIVDETISVHTFPESIDTVGDLKNYLYPEEISRCNRIIFLYNGISMLDSKQLCTFRNFIVDKTATTTTTTITPTIICIIKSQLQGDQISCDSNTDQDPLVYTWTTIRKLYFLLAALFILLWTCRIFAPKYFDQYTSLMLVVFTLTWMWSFYSSRKRVSKLNQHQ